jgi:hypothetical protein
MDRKTLLPIQAAEELQGQASLESATGSASEDIAKAIEQEKTFYRDLLEQVCQDARKTRARRLVESGLMFWDQMQAEKSKRAEKD